MLWLFARIANGLDEQLRSQNHEDGESDVRKDLEINLKTKFGPIRKPKKKIRPFNVKSVKIRSNEDLGLESLIPEFEIDLTIDDLLS